MSQKTLTILGSTGSIGVSALRVAGFLNNKFRVAGLSCGGNISVLEKQIEVFMPDRCAVSSESALASDGYKNLKKKYSSSIEFFEGEEGLIEFASCKSDITLSAIVGAAGLKPGLAAIGSSRRIALANKESLVMAGQIFMNSAREKGVEVIPVDSEHSAIFSIIDRLKPEFIDKVILTASGGSLRNRLIEELDRVLPEEALSHPTWNMGDKITIDSATLVNKGLEVIEAHHLFNLDYECIDVIIHPESVIHSMVETIDGAVYAHMGEADMAFPILNSLTYPEKVRNPFGRLNLAETGSLNFYKCDNTRYPALDICYEAGKTGGTAPAVLNAANEEAVDAFLNGKIKFTDIYKIIKEVTGILTPVRASGLDVIFESDREARELSGKLINSGDIK